MNDPTLPLEGLSPLSGKAIVARFDGGSLSSDSCLIALAEVEKRLRVAATLAACIDDPRRPEMVSHRIDEMIGFRMRMIAAGYEDANDRSRLKTDPVFKMAGDWLPCDEALASQSTICRLQNLPDRHMLLAMGHAMIDLHWRSFRAVPQQIVLDIDDTFDAVLGVQQLRLIDAHHDEYGFQTLVVFDDEGRFVTAVFDGASPRGTIFVITTGPQNQPPSAIQWVPVISPLPLKR